MEIREIALKKPMPESTRRLLPSSARPNIGTMQTASKKDETAVQGKYRGDIIE